MNTLARATNLEPQVLATGCLVPRTKVYLSLSFTSGLRSPAKVVYRPLAPLPSFGDVLLGTSPLAREEIESFQLVTIDFPWLGSLPPNLHSPSHFSPAPFA